jgi:AcrR family transcriptional regulator
MTPGLIYYYLKSKEDLLKVVLEERSLLLATTQIHPEMVELPPDYPRSQRARVYS